MTTPLTNRSVILMVDDTPTNLDVLVHSFSDYGFELSVAVDGETALEQSQLEHPDLILLDVMMPGIDGFETCRRLKENEDTKDIPVIFMTSLSDTLDKVKGFEAGAVDYVTKPLQHEEVLARVSTHLKIHSLQMQLEGTISSLQQEVAERKRAEEALREAEEKYRSIYENAIEGIYQTTPEGRYLNVNPSLARMYGYATAEELVANITNVGAQIYVDPNRRETYAKLLKELGTVQGFESQVYRKDSTIIWISEDARVARDGSGQVAYYEGMVQDITARKQAEQALREAMILTQKANERMRHDLEAAARIQQALLPESIPTNEYASFAWVYRPCAELGGDSLNVFQLDGRHMGMYVLDVSGHGVQASLLSVTLSRVLTPRHDPSCLFTRADLLTGVGALASPAEVASRLNSMFPMGAEGRQYFTLVYGILDAQHRQFRYVCAGHPAPIHYARSRGHQPGLCEARSLPIGLFEEEYEESTVELEHGDRIYLYSDGVLEAMNHKREIFDDARLISAIEDTQTEGLKESVDSIVKAVLNWSGTDQVHDDLSILAVEFT